VEGWIVRIQDLELDKKNTWLTQRLAAGASHGTLIARLEIQIQKERGNVLLQKSSIPSPTPTRRCVIKEG